ncbi:hypothetical protein ACS0TY_019091 [Phlomoides rotata]
MQNQLVCSRCRTMLLYPSGASNVCCAICNMVTSVQPAGMEMTQLICGGCRTLLMHSRGATSVRCSCCHTVNLVPGAAPPPLPPNNVAHVNCGNCHTMLMYPAGAPSVKCAICHFITNVIVSTVLFFTYVVTFSLICTCRRKNLANNHIVLLHSSKA